MNLFEFDRTYIQDGTTIIAGVDEAGRGPWAGPVVAAAVILQSDTFIEGLNDSKKLSAAKREKLFIEISQKALSFSVETISHDIIDDINILEATFLAMKGAIGKLSIAPQLVLVDGCWKIPAVTIRQEPIIGGDGKSAAVAAASIMAKVTRDRIMAELSLEYPQYNFQKHKGYGTKEHMAALSHYGPCPVHRKSFAPVRLAIEKHPGRG